MEYLTETHSHTADVSVCAESSAEELVSLYKEAGYSTVVLTNHMNGSAFSRPGITDWQKKIDHLMRGYDKAYKLAGNNLNLLFGFEINFYGYCNDYLVYGATEEMLRNNGDLMAMPVTEFSSLAKSVKLNIFVLNITVNMLVTDSSGSYNGNLDLFHNNRPFLSHRFIHNILSNSTQYYK